jgi:antirestriction protein ArdC
MKTDLYQQVTDKVLAMMAEHGTKWLNPMREGKHLNLTMPRNVASRKNYRGINIPMLAWAGYSSPVWGTYKQWADKGAQVLKGQKATPIVFWQFVEKIDPETGLKSTIPFLRQYAVFNAEQVEGYDAESEALPEVTPVERDARADAFFSAIPASVSHTQHARAFYSPSLDVINLPAPEQFVATPTSTALESYYSTLAHELTHWTGHKSRLNRLTGDGFGSQEYAREELVAELGAAFLCAELGISNEPRADHAQYLNSWMRILSDKNREFIKAAGAAQKAVDLLAGYSSAEADDVETLAEAA